MPEAADRLETAASLARYLNVHRMTLYRWVRQNRIPSVKLHDRAFRFDRSAVMAALKAKGQEGAADAK